MTKILSSQRWNKLKLIFKPGSRLSQRILFAGIWLTLLRVSIRGLGIIRVIVLARILDPEAFGLVSVALLTIEFANQVTATGFNSALVQKKGEIESYLDTVWTMLVIRGVILGAIITLGAPLVAALFDTPEATPFIQAMGAVLVLRGFVNSGIVYFSKELEVNKRFIWEMSGAVAEISVAITLAIILQNAWAIVLGAIAGSATTVIVSFIIHPFRPHLKLNLNKFKELFSFGMWVLFTAITFYAFTRLDSIIVGRYLGIVSLGIYTMAYTLCRPVSDEVANLSENIVFPALSKIQNDVSLLHKAILTSMEFVSLVVLPLAVILFFLAPDFIITILGDKWIDAIPVLRIVSIAMAIYALQGTGGAAFLAIGRPRIRFGVFLIATLIMIGALFIFVEPFGLVGAAYSVLAGTIGGLLVLFFALVSLLGMKLKDLLRSYISAIIICLALVIIIYTTKFFITGTGIAELIAFIFIIIITYAGSSFLIWKFLNSGPFRIVYQLVNHQMF